MSLIWNLQDQTFLFRLVQSQQKNLSEWNDKWRSLILASKTVQFLLSTNMKMNYQRPISKTNVLLLDEFV